jgi:hypothetical protein
MGKQTHQDEWSQEQKDAIIESVMNCTRSQAEIFDSLVQQMKTQYNISEEEAPEAARNLIRFVEILMDIPSQAKDSEAD